MRYETANAFRTALESRLLARARSDNVPLIRLRKLVAFDRLIARLMVVAPDRWVLKGAVALQFRAGPEYRTTRDIDFGRRDDEAAATSDLLAAQSLDLGDCFSFAIEREGPIDLGDSAPSNHTIKRLFSHCLDVLEAEARRLIAQVLDADGGILFAVSHTREAPAAKSVQNRAESPWASPSAPGVSAS